MYWLIVGAVRESPLPAIQPRLKRLFPVSITALIFKGNSRFFVKTTKVVTTSKLIGREDGQIINTNGNCLVFYSLKSEL